MKRIACIAGLCVLGAALNATAAEDRVGYVRNIVIERGQEAGDLICFLCSVQVAGDVSGDVVVIGGDIEIEGAVANDAVVLGGAIHLGPGARLAGDAIAVAGPVTRSPRAEVSGETVSKPWAYFPGQRHPYAKGVAALAAFQFGLAVMFCLVLRRRRVERLAAVQSAHRIWAFLSGLGVAVLFSALYYAGALSPRGSMVVQSALTVLLLALLGVGYAGVGFWLGRKFVPQGLFAATLAGTLVLIIATLIPIVGFVAWLFFAMMALGSSVPSRFGAQSRATSG